MKLLYIHHLSLEKNAANIIQVLYMCYAFKKIGVEITLLVPIYEVKDQSKLREIAKEKLGKEINFDLRFFEIKKTILGYSFSVYFALSKILTNYSSFDAIFCRHFLVNNVCLKSGFKTIFEIHAIELHSNKLIDKIYHNLVIKDSMKKNQLIFISISEALAKYWISRGVPKDKIKVLHDGALEEEFKNDPGIENSKVSLKIDLKKKNIVYVGSLYKDRNIEYIIELAKDFPEQNFSIVGGDEEQVAYYKKMSSDKKITNITFYGYLNRKKVITHLYAADILLLIWSWKVKTIKICSPLKVFEAMAVRRIIIAQAFPTIKEVLIDNMNAILCEPDNYESLKNKMQVAVKNNFTNNIEENAYKDFVNKFSWEKRTKFIIEEIKDKIKC